MKEVNAILCNRLHSFKKRYYRLDIVVGKIVLLKYPSFFAEEDYLALELKELYKDYEKRTSLAMIPFYSSRLEFMGKELQHKKSFINIPKSEIEFLEQNISETSRLLNSERSEV
jgi:hypothetical protein